MSHDARICVQEFVTVDAAVVSDTVMCPAFPIPIIWNLSAVVAAKENRSVE